MELVEQGKPINQLNQIDTEYNKIVDELKSTKVDEHNLNKVMDQIFALMRYSLRCQGKTDNQIEQIMKTEVKLQVKEVQKAQRNIVKLVVESIGYGLSGLGAIGSGVSLCGKVLNPAGKFVLSPNNWKGWGVLSHTSDVTQKLGDPFARFGGGIAGHNDQANNTGKSNVLEMMKAELRKVSENAREADQKMQQLANKDDQRLQGEHQTKLRMAGG